jgi:hypothetical protein
MDLAAALQRLLVYDSRKMPLVLNANMFAPLRLFKMRGKWLKSA